MTAAVLVFAALGAAVAGLLALVLRPGPGLLAAIGRLDAARGPTSVPTRAPAAQAGRADWQLLIGTRAAQWLTRRGSTERLLGGAAGRRAQDLAITDRSEELLLGRQVVSGLVGLVFLPAAAIALGAVGLQIPVAVMLGSPVLAVGCAWLPQHELHHHAEAQRREFRHALSSYLDLVAMSLAGGRGAPQALAETAALSEARAFRMLADALVTARLTGANHWHALGELGRRLGLPELGDLAASLTLVGDHGARVRETLAARAATLRRRALTDAEGNAAQADQGMRIAQVLLALGFLVLIAYPALAAVLAM